MSELRSSEKSTRVVISGGSIGGLCAGVALRGHGATVDIFERHPGPMETRGAGIVVQPELIRLFQRYGAPPLPTTSCQVRRYLEPDGGDGRMQSMPQRFTSWEAIYLTLRTVFPDERYHTGATVQGFENRNDVVRVDIIGHSQVDADLLICADGAQSEMRSRLLPQVQPHYAGYIAWRGTLDEASAPPGLVTFFENAFTFSEARAGGHLLVYLIPGAQADPTPGRRQINWVWYVRTREQELGRLLTDRHGYRHHHSLPQGAATEEALAALCALARREVHPRMAALVETTPDPFIQTIVDVAPQRTVFGRACLLGDAAFVIRPHTAAASAKAASDAMVLAEALEQCDGDVNTALAAFQRAQLRNGQELHQYGVALGNRWAKPVAKETT